MSKAQEVLELTKKAFGEDVTKGALQAKIADKEKEYDAIPSEDHEKKMACKAELDKMKAMLKGMADQAEAAVSEHIRHEGGKWNLYSKKTGKLLGSHDSKEDAIKQEVAIKYAQGK